MRLVNKVILDSEISSKVAWEYKVEPRTLQRWMRKSSSPYDTSKDNAN